MISKEQFVKGFQEMMSGKVSTKDFASMAMEYFNSPDYNRWKAAQAAEQLKDWKEGRAHLMSLIEGEKKAGTVIDYDVMPLKEGHDSLCVTANGRRICFPSYFPKECVDMNWGDLMEGRASKRPCGNLDCSTSTSIDDVTLTFGRGNLDEHGYWEIPCGVCAEAYQKDFPDHPVWPRKEA